MARSKKRASLGVLFWIAFILFILVVFLFNRSNINEVLERTQLVDVLKDRVGVTPREPEVVRTDDGEALPEQPPREETPDPDPAPVEENPVEDSVEVVVEPPPESTEPAAEDAPAGTEETATDTPPEDTEVVVESQSRPNVRTADIYFIRVTDEGRIMPQKVERTVYYQDSPMTETLRALLSGPTSDELSIGLLNLIPEGTKLLSAAVRDGTAILNFNEAFKFNTMGAEGTIAQLQQIVFSSTEFSTVDSVQILIDGQKLEYLSGEGIYIGSPLDRSSFG
jgi:spore germination protein GerM